jgi:hypothetical protein
MSTALGLVTGIGDGEFTGSVDIAPAARDGQALIAVWAGQDADGEPALIDLRSALALAVKLPKLCEEAITLAAGQLGSAA